MMLFVVLMTNFSLACVGYVVDHINSKSANSLLFSIIALAQRIRRVPLATQHKSATSGYTRIFCGFSDKPNFPRQCTKKLKTKASTLNLN